MLRRLVLGVVLAMSFAASASARTTVENRALAHRDARRLLAAAPVPPGATPSATEPAGDGGVLGFVGRPARAALADDRRFLVDPANLGTVEAFYAAHPPGRADGTGSSGGPGVPANRTTDYAVRGSVVGLSSRSVIVNLVALGSGSTGIRIDAQATWLVERSPAERVPTGVRSLTVSVSSGSSTGGASIDDRFSYRIGEPRRIAEIARWIDALPVVQPGVFDCPAQPANPTVVRLVFRGAGGRSLAAAAQAVSPDAGTSPCDAMTFSFRGRPEPALLDGGAFLRRVGTLLHVDLHVPRP